MNLVQEKIKELYDGYKERFEEVKAEINSAGMQADGLFEPYVGSKYDLNSSEERLMIVGKAPHNRQDNEKSDREEPKENDYYKDDGVFDCQRFIEEGVIPRSYNKGRGSAFWRHAIEFSLRFNKLVDCKGDDREALEKALRDTSENGMRKKALERIVWSNVMKISIKDGNPPSGKAHRIQRKVCIELLQKEIEYCKPTRLVFVSGNNYLHDVFQVLGFCKLVVPPDMKEEKTKSDAYELNLQPQPLVENCTVYLTRHPERWKLEDKNPIMEVITRSP